MECQFCNKILSSLGNLKVHQRTVKYCLKIQNDSDPVIQRVKHECSYCYVKFTVKSRLLYHEKICKSNPTIYPLYIELVELRQTNEQQVEEITNLRQTNEQQVEEITNLSKLRQTNEQQVEEITNLKQSIKVSQREIEIISKQNEKYQTGILDNIGTKNITTINHVNIFLEKAEPVTANYLKLCSDQLTSNLHSLNADGYATHFDNILKGRIVCIDYSRRKIKYKDENGNIIEEIGHGPLMISAFENIKDMSLELSNNRKDHFVNDLGADEKELNGTYDIHNDIVKGSKGIETQNGNIIIKKICKKNTLSQLKINSDDVVL